MNKYRFASEEFDSIDLKCMIVSKGVQVDPEIYQRFGQMYNISQDPMRLSCIILSDGTVTTFSDMAPYLNQLGKRYFWSEEEKKKYHPQLETPFYIRVADEKPALFFHAEFIDFITFPEKNDFYDQRTRSGMPFAPTAVLQGTDWLTFGYLWPCDYAKAGMPCQYCHCGNATMAMAQNHVPFEEPVSGETLAEIAKYALENCGSRNIQVTGGSTFSGELEKKYFKAYIDALNRHVGKENIPGDIVYYITPPEDFGLIDYYIENGVDKIGCSVEVWDPDLARIVTPGKIQYTTRRRHLDALEYMVNQYGPGIAFSQFVAGIEPFESLKEGSIYMAERGITPVISILQMTGLTVNGKTAPPDIDYYRRVKELYLELYAKYDIIPAEQSGENGCIEIEFLRAVRGQ